MLVRPHLRHAMQANRSYLKKLNSLPLQFGIETCKPPKEEMMRTVYIACVSVGGVQGVQKGAEIFVVVVVVV